MKVLLVGSDFKYGIEQYFIKYLKEFGCEIIHYAAPDISMKERSGNLAKKILFKTGVYEGYGKLNNELIRLSRNSNPDVIWIFKGMEILPDTLRELGKSFKLANYNPDHPYIISGSGSGNKNVTGSVALYHLHFCYNSSLQKQIESRYGIPTVFLPFGFELSTDEYIHAAAKPGINRVCFIGNPDKTRVGILCSLADNGFEVDVYGHGWQNTAVNRLANITHTDAVYGIEFWDKLRQYRVQLNIFRKHNLGSHNMRSFEIPAVGGIQLAPFSQEQADFFSAGREIFFYRDERELLDQVKKIMLLPDAEMNTCREAARTRSVSSGYSYRDRSLTVYESFKKLIS